MSTLHTDYENCLIQGKKLDLTYHYPGSANSGALKSQAISCIKFALNDLLGWSVAETKRKLDQYTLNLMKLDGLVRYIPFPLEVPAGDIDYLLHLLYPDDAKISEEDLVLKVYLKVLNNSMQFPKDYFVGSIGFYRLCVCVKYLVENFKVIPEIDKLYEFYGSSSGNEYLRNHKLKIPVDILEIDPAACIYELTKEEPSSLFYYCFTQINKVLTKEELLT